MTDHPVTYHEASEVPWPSVLMRWQELDQRDAVARSLVSVQQRGEYDLQRHGRPEDNPPLTVAEHLELLALGEVAARHFRHPSIVHHAVGAGATWAQIAAAVGTTIVQARQAYRQWARGQYLLRQQFPDGTLGMGDDEYAEAIRRAADITDAAEGPQGEPPTAGGPS